jgi:hypothetical protein
MPGEWTLVEVEAIVSDYLDMLEMELKGQRFSKIEYNRKLQSQIGRSKGSIEFKHANISAILIEEGFPYIDGYKPRSNYQELLRDAVLRRLEFHKEIESLTIEIVNKQPDPSTKKIDFASILVAPPAGTASTRDFSKLPSWKSNRNPNYLAIEASNRSLGAEGEKFIMEYEHYRLWISGLKSLAERIDRVSVSQGDHVGYDIQSFDPDGRPRRIEVKTTRFGLMTPFFASANEVETSKRFGDEYHLYRLFKFEKSPKLFIVNGSLRDRFKLKPIQFQARIG